MGRIYMFDGIRIRTGRLFLRINERGKAHPFSHDSIENGRREHTRLLDACEYDFQV